MERFTVPSGQDSTREEGDGGTTGEGQTLPAERQLRKDIGETAREAASKLFSFDDLSRLLKTCLQEKSDVTRRQNWGACRSHPRSNTLLYTDMKDFLKSAICGAKRYSSDYCLSPKGRACPTITRRSTVPTLLPRAKKWSRTWADLGVDHQRQGVRDKAGRIRVKGCVRGLPVSDQGRPNRSELCHRRSGAWRMSPVRIASVGSIIVWIIHWPEMRTHVCTYSMYRIPL